MLALKRSKPYTAKVLVINTKTANGLNLVIINPKNTLIILFISISKFFKINIFSPRALIHKPTTTAKNTIDNTIELFVITLATLFGTALSTTSRGLLPVDVVTDVVALLERLTLKIQVCKLKIRIHRQSLMQIQKLLKNLTMF